MLRSDVLSRMYRHRFAPEADSRDAVWKVLCRDFFQKYIPEDATVLDLATGYGEFINNIRAGKKIALDINADCFQHLGKDIITRHSSSTCIDGIGDESIDVVFISNFLEHLSKDDILTTLEEIRRVLKPEGSVLILGPNMRYCYDCYWNYFDHITPLDDYSLSELLVSHEFELIECIPRFLPYSMNSRFPKSPLLVKAYLKASPLWYIMGKQMFLHARRK